MPYKHGDGDRGSNRAPEYEAWAGMNQRCYNPNNKMYIYYGGRGITVCDEWRSNYIAFLSHVGRKPSPEYSIERIDNNKGYEPGNVKWANLIEQASNKSNVIKIEFNGKNLTLAEWSRELGIKYSTLQERRRRGFSIEDILYKGLFGTHPREE